MTNLERHLDSIKQYQTSIIFIQKCIEKCSANDYIDYVNVKINLLWLIKIEESKIKEMLGDKDEART